MAEAMKATVASMLQGIDRYNPENLTTLEKYIEIQTRENAYDLEANLAVLKLYQFNASRFRLPVVQLILLKALTNLPHTDFVLCKCLIEQVKCIYIHSHAPSKNYVNVSKVNGPLQSEDIKHIVILHDLLETCQFTNFWSILRSDKFALKKVVADITGFEDSIRKFICHVVNITYQHIEQSTLSEFLGNLKDFELRSWMSKYGWKDVGNGLIFIGNQEENIKTKNITEKIDFESVAAIMSLAR